MFEANCPHKTIQWGLCQIENSKCEKTQQILLNESNVPPKNKLVGMIGFCMWPSIPCLSAWLRVCLVHTGSSYRLTNVLPSAPDISQLKLGVRSVAGKLSVMASGVVSSIQVGEETQHLKPDHINILSNKLTFLFPGSLQFLSHGVSSLGFSARIV